MPRWENGFQTNEEIQRYKRSAVIREAARIMSRWGFHNTSLDEVAKVLGISKGTLYNYVKDKQEILFECHNIALDLGVYAENFAKNCEGHGIDRLRILLRCYIIWMYGQAGVGGVTFDVNALRDDYRAAVIKRRDVMEAGLIAFLDTGVDDGSVKPCDTKIAVYTLMTAINGIATWFSIGGRLTIEEVADQLLDQLTLSLASSPGQLIPYPPIPAYPTPDMSLSLNRNAPPGVGSEKKPRLASANKKAVLPKRRTRTVPSNA